MLTTNVEVTWHWCSTDVTILLRESNWDWRAESCWELKDFNWFINTDSLSFNLVLRSENVFWINDAASSSWCFISAILFSTWRITFPISSFPVRVWRRDCWSWDFNWDATWFSSLMSCLVCLLTMQRAQIICWHDWQKMSMISWCSLQTESLFEDFKRTNNFTLFGDDNLNSCNWCRDVFLPVLCGSTNTEQKYSSQSTQNTTGVCPQWSQVGDSPALVPSRGGTPNSIKNITNTNNLACSKNRNQMHQQKLPNT